MAPLPLALTKGTDGATRVTPVVSSLPSSAQTTVAELATQFADTIASTGLNPEDPAYLEAWIDAAKYNDMLLKQRLGVVAWQKLKAETAQQAYREANPQFEEVAQP